MALTLPTLQVAELEPPGDTAWLVDELWGHEAVGIIGGAPKCCKSWLALDLAVSVASGTACLGRYAVEDPGPALIYLAEDALGGVRERVAALCAHRGLSLHRLPLHVVTAASLRLDREEDRARLNATIEALQPRLLVLDPLVRLHRLDENSASEISGLLGYLRELNRRHHLALVLVHHMSKKARAHLGQALRGSGDLHAWTDSACYLVRRKAGLQLTVEHRAAPAPEPMLLQLATEPPHLELLGADLPPPPLADAVRDLLRAADGPRSRAALRRALRVNNQRLGEALTSLEGRGLALRTPTGWVLPTAGQLPLLG
ncbi:MAG: AAA family ATPase [Actinomycetia bacterium]|nr:AAA family ATPase [Actinomycetes bacterium]